MLNNEKSFACTICCNLLSFMQKNIEQVSSKSNYIESLKADLKDSLNVSDYANLDFERSVITKKDNDTRFFRVPFIGKKFSEEFVLLHTDTLGKVLKGLVIQLHQDKVIDDAKNGYNGRIQILYLNRTINIISDIKNGYITAFHKSSVAQRSLVVPDKGKTEYPDIITDYYYLNTNGGMPSNYVNSSGFFGFNSGGRSVSYSSMEGGSNDEGDGGSRSNSEREDKEDEMLVDFEFVEDLSPIDITKYIKCFSSIPDIGSTCSIKILVDIPVDYNPNRLFNLDQSSPGHTFLQITKTNGGQSVTQNIGFYPNAIWKMLLYEPVQNKIVDNGEHEFNVSLTMNITPEQLSSTLNYLSNLSNHDYDVDDYNCTDFALEVFNQLRVGNPIEIEKMLIPGGVTFNTSTPGALYSKLSIMQRYGTENANINFPQTKAFASPSSGPCN